MPSHLGNVLLHGADLWSWITPPPTLNSTQRSENSTMRWKCNTKFHTNDFISKTLTHWIFYIWKKALLKINRVGAQTSINLFLYASITQWYWNFSTAEQFCRTAIPLQFLFLAAMSHSNLEIGQDVTVSTLSTASWQYLFSVLDTYW